MKKRKAKYTKSKVIEEYFEWKHIKYLAEVVLFLHTYLHNNENRKKFQQENMLTFEMEYLFA